MKAHCNHCKKVVELLDGYTYKKCPICYNPVYPTIWEKAKVMLGVKNE